MVFTWRESTLIWRGGGKAGRREKVILVLHENKKWAKKFLNTKEEVEVGIDKDFKAISGEDFFSIFLKRI